MMSASTTRFAPSRRMGVFEALHPLSMWEESFDDGGSVISPGRGTAGACMIDGNETAQTKMLQDDKIEYMSDKSADHAEDGHASRSLSDKMQRRLAQNREAARKSRLRKKAYVQQLESSRLKLAQLELELERVRQHGLTANIGLCRTVNSGIAAFEIEYGHWLGEQERKMSELKSVLQTPIGDVDLRRMVENVLNHYCNLFRMKREAASADAFYLVSGMWRTPVERFFLWIGGFRPSELISVVMPHLEPLTEQQIVSVVNLKHSCMQAEDALSQGMEKLQQTLAQSITLLAMGAGNYTSQTASAIEKLESMESFVQQADHLREQTLQQVSRTLTTRQAAKGLLAFGQYFQSLRSLSSLWSARSTNEPA